MASSSSSSSPLVVSQPIHLNTISSLSKEQRDVTFNTSNNTQFTPFEEKNPMRTSPDASSVLIVDKYWREHQCKQFWDAMLASIPTHVASNIEINPLELPRESNALTPLQKVLRDAYQLQFSYEVFNHVRQAGFTW